MRPIDEPWLRYRATRCSTFKIYRHRYREIRARGRCVTAVEKRHAPRTTMNHCLSFGFEQFFARARCSLGSYSVGSAMFREGWRDRWSKRTRRKDRWKRIIDTGVGSCTRTSLLIFAHESHSRSPDQAVFIKPRRRDATNTHNKIRKKANHVRPSFPNVLVECTTEKRVAGQRGSVVRRF